MSLRRLALEALGTGIEAAFRAIPRALGRRIGPADGWLWGPLGPDYYAALARERGLVLEADDPDAGLLPDFAALRSTPTAWTGASATSTSTPPAIGWR